MTATQRRVLRRGAAVLAAAAATAAMAGPTVAQAGVVNRSPGYLVVYNNNVENMLPVSCDPQDRTDINRLFAYIKAQPKSPDVFTVQQVSDTKQLNALTKRMTDQLPGTYAGVIALTTTGSMGYTSACGRLKNHQTNAVVYRTDRFSYEASVRWRSDAPENWSKGTGPCRNLQNTPTSQDRVENVAVRLHDRVAKQDVTVASIHWPTSTWHGPDCADENLREASAAVDGLGGTLKIVAGDANTTKGTRGWWNDARADGFRDPIAETCGSTCPSSTSTLGSRRIDFLLVKSGHGFSGAKTITEKMTGGTYSDHRALTAYVKY